VPTSATRFVANIATLVDKARDEGVPVVWVQHSDEQLEKGSDAWKHVPELTRREAEPLVQERRSATPSRAPTWRRACEGWRRTPWSWRARRRMPASDPRIHGALVRGYDVTLVADAHTTEDQSAWGAPPPAKVIAHTNLYWRFETAPGRTATVTETKNVTFRD